jgi:hypothetical protein
MEVLELIVTLLLDRYRSKGMSLFEVGLYSFLFGEVVLWLVSLAIGFEKTILDELIFISIASVCVSLFVVLLVLTARFLIIKHIMLNTN